MRVNHALSTAMLAIATAISAPAWAQNETTAADQAAETNQTQDIVVTAQFRATKLQDTPIAITAVNNAMLEARGQTDIAQVAAQAPNVSLRPQPQNGGSGLIAFIRGVGQTDFNYALDPGVGVYIDDVYIPTLSSSLLELIDLDRVEILRGPQGTLAGKNAIGGAIKLFSAKPKGDGSGSMQVEYGSYNALSVRGMADFKITDNLAVRVSGMSRGRDGYVGMLDYGQTHPNSNVPGNLSRGSGNSDYATMGGQNIIAGRAALRWTPAPAVEVNVSADYTRERSEAIPVVLIAAGAIAPAGTTFDPKSVGNSASLSSFPPPTYANPWLVGKNGQPVNMSCAFVPAGQYSCDTGGNLQGWDPRFVSYSNFMDGMAPTSQAPYKPYFALPITNFNGWGVHGDVTFDLNDNVNLVYIGSYRAYNSKFGQDQDGTPLPVAQLDNQLDHHAFSSEVRLNFKLANGFVEGTVGGFYLDQKGTYTARVDLNYVAPATIDFLHGPDTTPSTTKAVFGTLTLHPVEGMSVTGGLRYTKDKKDYTYFRRNPDGSIPNPATCALFTQPNCLLAGIYGITGSFRGDRWDYRLSADYRFSEQFLAYASVSTGFKGGGVNPRPFVADQRLPFKPETLTTYEVGFKADLFDRRVRLNGAAFLNKYKDIVLSKLTCPESVLPTPCLRPDNIGSADVKGFELEATIRPVDGLSIDGSFSYLDFKYTSPTTSAGLLVGSAIPGSAITPYTPKTSYSIGAQYDYQTNIGLFGIRFDGSYQGDLFTTSENTSWSKIPGRFLGNGQLSFTSMDKDWKLILSVQNIFNKYYFTSISDVSSSLGIVSGVPGLPRTWAISVKRSF
ncbi:TonB-dependent receptor [Sphingobium nicotianae]|uniref:TonB-dependent receptor n=1 Tax=Sphingobium nicotianae TaxID=2782607 RepID=A0A9X1DBM6_9SPHN|nr:TonB-dependent receptor [Sphingobium nicotianae]MBT2186982.1 TonB-dependent receptor [Sphingobium nicotianae]